MSSFHSEAGANIKHILSGQCTKQTPFAISSTVPTLRGKELAIFCQQRFSARFDLHVWTHVLKNIGDSKTFFLGKRM